MLKYFKLFASVISNPRGLNDKIKETIHFVWYKLHIVMFMIIHVLPIKTYNNIKNWYFSIRELKYQMAWTKSLGWIINHEIKVL